MMTVARRPDGPEMREHVTTRLEDSVHFHQGALQPGDVFEGRHRNDEIERLIRVTRASNVALLEPRPAGDILVGRRQVYADDLAGRKALLDHPQQVARKIGADLENCLAGEATEQRGHGLQPLAVLPPAPAVPDPAHRWEQGAGE